MLNGFGLIIDFRNLLQLLAFPGKALESFRLRRMLRKATPRILRKVLITDLRDGSRRRQPLVLPNEPRRQNGSSATDAGKAMHQNSAALLDLSVDERENKQSMVTGTFFGSNETSIAISAELRGLPR